MKALQFWKPTAHRPRRPLRTDKRVLRRRVKADGTLGGATTKGGRSHGKQQS